jgi:dinuclear metal center YbgI/SA1388 family protein
MELTELVNYTGQLLEVSRFRDYCPNGLQVEGRPQVKRIVAGVSASMALLEAAADQGADAILVHHGWFWKSDEARVTGVRKKRLAFLLERDISLLAYHLPLDAHPELGNNASLARLFSLEITAWFGEQQIAAVGEWKPGGSLGDFSAMVSAQLGREPMVIGDFSRNIKRVAWCSGAAQDYLAQAVDLDVDVYLTGEISEHTVHLARESGVAFVAAGHHATERYGAKALGEHLASRFGIECKFVDLDNPV